MIRVRGRVTATLPRAVVHDLGIAPGMRWTNELARQVESLVHHDKARRAALRILDRRALSRGELVDRLVRKEFDRATASRVADGLVEKGFIDDAAYAQATLRALVQTKPAGRRLMQRKLMQKRIERDLADRVIDAFLQQTPDGGADADSNANPELEAFVERRAEAMRHLAPEVRARRLYGLLARRGFDPETCRRFVQHAIAIDEE